jgi:hypothetical protein
MKLTATVFLFVAGLFLAVTTLAIPACAQQNPFAVPTPYTPQSNTALSITGTIRFSSRSISIHGKSYALTLSHALTADELAATKPLFSIDTATSGFLFQTSIPANAPMLNGNSICNAKCTWVLAVYTAPDQLNLAFITGDATPSLAPGALMHSSSVTGTYWYAKERR